MLVHLAGIVQERALTREEVADAIHELLRGGVPNEVKAAFLRAWAQRGETAEELAACAETMLPEPIHASLRGTWKGQPLLDCCGTGGGGLNVLNISTGLMFLLAAMGIPVVKHGNRGITKNSGSADVLETLRIKINLSPKHVTHCLEEIGCAFLFAPAYYPTLASIAPVRRALGAEGQRTIFNLIGPLLNPARPQARLIGVFKQTHLELYQRALELMHCPRFTIAFGTDSDTGKLLGEVSAKGTTLFASTVPLPDGTPLTEFGCDPPAAAAENVDSLLVQSADESAVRIQMILSGEDQGLARETLLVNAAVAAWTQGIAPVFDEGMERAVEALDSGHALTILRKWQDFSSDFK